MPDRPMPSQPIQASELRPCFAWLEEDYAMCALTKHEADTRFLACATRVWRGAVGATTAPCNRPPADPVHLPEWWSSCINHLPVSLEARERLTAAFDCETFARRQQGAYVFCMKWKPEDECTIDFKVRVDDYDTASGDGRRR